MQMQMHMDVCRRVQTNADTHEQTQMHADECKANCIQCVGRRNFKMCPDVRGLFKDFQDQWRRNMIGIGGAEAV